MTSAPSDADTMAAALPAVLAQRTRGAFEDLLAPAVRWGGHEDDEHTCHNREQAGETYAALLADGLHLTVISTKVRDDQVIANLHVTDNETPDSGFQSRVVLTVAGGKIIDILQVDDHEAQT